MSVFVIINQLLEFAFGTVGTALEAAFAATGAVIQLIQQLFFFWV